MHNFTPDEMRTMGYQVIDMVVEHYATVADKSATRNGTRAELEALLREPVPTDGANFEELLAQLRDDVFTKNMHVDHPRFFAFVPSPSNYISAIAETLIAGHNAFNGIWTEGSGAAQIELITLDWLRELCGMPESAGGIFLSGGSMANMTGLAVARQVRLGRPDPDAVVYASAQAHSSVERALKVLGFYPDQLHQIPVDDEYRLDVDALTQAIQADKTNGRRPFCVVANAGATNTGAVDPLSAIADICDAYDLWFHVDGAYGAATALCQRGKTLLAGMDRAHSLILDPHKWLFQPISMGCLLVQDQSWLRESFHILPEYLADVEAESGGVNFCDRGVQLTREFSALKLWLSLKFYGLTAFQDAIEQGFESAELVQGLIEAESDWEVVTPAQMGIITFRYAPKHLAEEVINDINRGLVDDIIADGFAMLTSTKLRDNSVLRMCTINPRTTEIDIEQTIEWLGQLARSRVIYAQSGLKPPT